MMEEDLKFTKIVSAEIFYEAIDNLVKHHDLSYMDAIVYYCEKNDIEIETAASLIKGNFRIKSSIQSEGEQLNFLPKAARLPI
jgi:hypothetical protein